MGDVVGDEAAGLVAGEWYEGAEALALDGLVPAFDLAVGLRVLGRGLDVGHAGDADELLEVLGDELGPLSLMMRGRASGDASRARWMIVSTSISSIFSRISQCTMKRL